jgi:hypothetical protein
MLTNLRKMICMLLGLPEKATCRCSQCDCLFPPSRYCGTLQDPMCSIRCYAVSIGKDLSHDDD